MITLDKITGHETAEEFNDFIDSAITNMSAQVTGDGKARMAKAVILEHISTGILSNVLFNTAYANCEGNFDMIPSLMLAHMDDIKEEINDLCAHNMKLFRENKVIKTNSPQTPSK